MNDQAQQDDLARSLLGDGAAYGRLVARHQIMIARRLRSFSRQPEVIEELVQETFVEAYVSLRKYRGEGEFAAWLQRIATRVGYRHWKRRDRRREVFPEREWWNEVVRATRHTPDPGRAAAIVQTLLEQLPPRDRLVLLLLHVEGYSIAEAARQAGWSQTMVRVQAYRARAKLRKLLARSGVRDIADILGSEPNEGMDQLADDERPVAAGHEEVDRG